MFVVRRRGERHMAAVTLAVNLRVIRTAHRVAPFADAGASDNHRGQQNGKHALQHVNTKRFGKFGPYLTVDTPQRPTPLFGPGLHFLVRDFQLGITLQAATEQLSLDQRGSLP
jgi:hypothetical protein